MRCRSHDPSRLPHHLLVSTDVSPVGAITVVRRAERRRLTAEDKKASVIVAALRCHGRFDVTELT